MAAKEQTMQDLQKESFLSGGCDAYLDQLYEDYLRNPADVSTEWQDYFKKISNELGSNADVSHEDIRDYFLKISRKPQYQAAGSHSSADLDHLLKQEKVINLIIAYRSLGHLKANIDPLGLYKGVNNSQLELSYYGFTEADLNTVFDVGSSLIGLKGSSAPLNEILDVLRKTYCNTIGIEYMHINDTDVVNWLQNRMEKDWLHFKPSHDEKLRILDRLVVADGLEKYLGFKYVGQKRFSLEGGDSLIPLLDAMIGRSAELGVKEAIIGMAHRGRLNVLVNVLGQSPTKVFAAFEGKNIDETNSGDVKYHMGFSADVKTKQSSIHLALAFNPSHLEIVSPVVQGSVRSRQRRRKDKECNLVMPIQIHGDAAFAGQGVVAETFNMSQTRWFGVGGSIHIVINNQIGFTISNPKDSRSTLYCTDIAKMVQPPVLHVNANDPEAVFFVAKLAADFRNQFKRDIVIDLVCYRRHGHNEADEPSATQPVMYKVIKSLPPPCTLYSKRLVAEGIIDNTKEQSLADAYRQALDKGEDVVETVNDPNAYEYSVSWEPYIDKEWNVNTNTGVAEKTFLDIAKSLEVLPQGFVLQPQVKKMMEARQKMTLGEQPINWGYAETMAYATLLNEGYPIRLCGQDACRGTFSHRHAVLHDQTNDDIYIPLSHVKPDQAQINLIDSLLSEEAVLAFEYGYASAEPKNLVIWEAQFGDFVNGAQVVIDQFISSGEQKWRRLCGLTMFLPHGYEGAGPEHSSARLERFLQMCAQNNMQVCVPTTPAQDFHMLRRQMLRPYRKPLIVMTPKSLLRHPLAVSTLKDLTDGEFQLVIPEIDDLAPKAVDRVVICCGKVYYDLLEKRRELKLNTVAIIRVEQLYPFPHEKLLDVLKPYAHVKQIIWCQEEPKNQGAWYSTQHYLHECLSPDQSLFYAGRASAASPSVGYMSVHVKEQQKLVLEALQSDF
jgi:2-oxoglutarate dehydrogenase E1 component